MTRITIETEIKFNDPLPDSVDVVVIGRGVVGVFTAPNLVAAGKHVLLCEKGRIAGEQLSRNWGCIRQHGRDEDKLPIAMQSVQLWKELDQTLQGECGIKHTIGPIGIRQVNRIQSSCSVYSFVWLAFFQSAVT